MTTLSGKITDGSNTACAKDCMTRTQMFCEDIPGRNQMKNSNSTLLYIADKPVCDKSIKKVAADSTKVERGYIELASARVARTP